MNPTKRKKTEPKTQNPGIRQRVLDALTEIPKTLWQIADQLGEPDQIGATILVNDVKREVGWHVRAGNARLVSRVESGIYGGYVATEMVLTARTRQAHQSAEQRLYRKLARAIESRTHFLDLTATERDLMALWGGVRLVSKDHASILGAAPGSAVAAFLLLSKLCGMRLPIDLLRRPRADDANKLGSAAAPPSMGDVRYGTRPAVTLVRAILGTAGIPVVDESGRRVDTSAFPADYNGGVCVRFTARMGRPSWRATWYTDSVETEPRPGTEAAQLLDRARALARGAGYELEAPAAFKTGSVPSLREAAALITKTFGGAAEAPKAPKAPSASALTPSPVTGPATPESATAAALSPVAGAVLYELRTSGPLGLCWYEEIVPRLQKAGYLCDRHYEWLRVMNELTRAGIRVVGEQSGKLSTRLVLLDQAATSTRAS